MSCHLCEDYGLQLCRAAECPFPLGGTEQWQPERLQCGSTVTVDDASRAFAPATANKWVTGCPDYPEPEPELEPVEIRPPAMMAGYISWM